MLLVKICTALKCDISDIMEITEAHSEDIKNYGASD
ncbi:MAG: helix-turn-helix domain-containing protein [Lachnospiraceae bacterium]|nr:helix-turn-helix domain-containing protein [Lachnospiraceae bacterium]